MVSGAQAGVGSKPIGPHVWSGLSGRLKKGQAAQNDSRFFA
jgi:hypothetical protein